MKRKKQSGSVTVEAILVLPFYLITIIFFLSFLDVFYIRLAVQQGMGNAASTLSQYCYAVDRLVGIEKLALSDETAGKVENITGAVDELGGAVDGTISAIGSAVETFKDATTGAITSFSQGIEIAEDTVQNLLDQGNAVLSAGKNLGEQVRSVNKDDIINYLATGAVETFGGLLVEQMVDDYLDQLKINRNLLPAGIKYYLYVDNNDGRYDLVLQAHYVYDNPMFSMFVEGFHIRQQVVAHPWIGGSTPGLE